MDMLSVEEALEKVLAYVPILEPEEKPILDALGQVLAEDVVAGFDIPRWPNSAMDGYAVRWESIRGASAESPRELAVIGEVPAGRLADFEVGSGQAARIFTGAPIPPGADTVVPFEVTDEAVNGRARREKVLVFKELPVGANIRPAGEDVRAGAVVLRRGQVLGPAQVALLAAVGRPTVRVIRRPLVAVVATGNELVPPGQALDPGQLYDCNSYGIGAMVRRDGGNPWLLGIAPDDYEVLAGKIRAAMAADLVITSAGVSVGHFDLVKEVLAELGEVHFWSIRMKPGKPLAFGELFDRRPDGTVRRVPHLGLPGNPVSALVTYELFGRPAVLKLMGRTDFSRPIVMAVAAEDIPGDRRRVYARVIVRRGPDGRYVARLTGPQGSGILTSMARANGLAVVPEDCPGVRAGETVQVMLLQWLDSDEGLEHGVNDDLQRPRF
ncbi:MAG: molybdopterin molybdenumtransferase MoeA [Chloroflexota bacterium]